MTVQDIEAARKKATEKARREALRVSETAEENAVRLGISSATAWRWARSLGIKFRSQRGR